MTIAKRIEGESHQVTLELPVFEGYEFEAYKPVKKGEFYVYADEIYRGRPKLHKRSIPTFDNHFVYRAVKQFEGFEYIGHRAPELGEYYYSENLDKPIKNYAGGISGQFKAYIYKNTFTPDYSNPDVLLAATFNAVMDNPDQWNQTQWHCGSSHCFCGWSQVLCDSFIENCEGGHIKFAMDRYQVSESVAGRITNAFNNLDYLYNWVDGLFIWSPKQANRD